MTFGSLFAGIGGLDLGLERAGMTCRWQVEIDPYARKVLNKHWPEVPKYEDVKTVGGDNLESVDLICGGFPCQDISAAGKGAGIVEGKKSSLWFEFARTIREIRPRFVLVENVPMLRKRGLDRVLGGLAACGYDAEWDCIPACALGAPHRRDRIWIVGYANSNSKSIGAQHAEASGVSNVAHSDSNRALVQGPHRDRHDTERHTAEEVQERQNLQPRLDATSKDGGMANPDRAQREGMCGTGRVFSQQPDPSGGGWWRAEPDVGRVANGVPSRVDRLKCLGNAVVPQVAEFIGRRIIEVSK